MDSRRLGPETRVELHRTYRDLPPTAWRSLALILGLAVVTLPAALSFADPMPRPPRPTMAGRAYQGAAPCSATPSDLATMQVVLVRDDGDGVCGAGDTDVLTTVAPNGNGGYVFPAATGEPGWQAQPGYCVRIQRLSLATPAAYGVVDPGTDDTATVFLDDICVP